MLKYVYYIKNKTTQLKYIGCKYGKNSNPDDFWVKYFTSSKFIKNLINLYGIEDFEISIRKTFNTKEECFSYETKLLKKLNAAKRIDFLNQHNNDNSNVKWDKTKRTKVAENNKKCIFITDGINDKRITSNEIIPEGWRRGRTKGKCFGKRSNEFREKMRLAKKGIPLSEKHKKSLIGLVRGMSGKNHSEETKHKMSVASKGKLKTEKHKANMSLSKRKKKECMLQKDKEPKNN